jgi:hypothetical protein
VDLSVELEIISLLEKYFFVDGTSWTPNTFRHDHEENHFLNGMHSLLLTVEHRVAN